MNLYQKIAIKALEQMRGDDLHRLRYAFKNCSPKMMKEEYANSGKSRLEILLDYEKRDAEITEAINWIKDRK
jgi:hypothetical protein